MTPQSCFLWCFDGRSTVFKKYFTSLLCRECRIIYQIDNNSRLNCYCYMYFRMTSYLFVNNTEYFCQILANSIFILPPG
jgi:hypothetical protein